jgi:hypothetical protein
MRAGRTLLRAEDRLELIHRLNDVASQRILVDIVAVDLAVLADRTFGENDPIVVALARQLLAAPGPEQDNRCIVRQVHTAHVLATANELLHGSAPRAQQVRKVAEPFERTAW